MISGAIIGDRALVARVGNMPREIKREVDATVQKLGYGLQAMVQRDFLTGQVLKVRTGRLRSSITQGHSESRSRFTSNANSAYAYVGTNVSYGEAWEKGIAARDIFPVNKKALRFTINGNVVFAMKAHIPAQKARPFLEPALQRYKPVIIRELQAALTRGAQRALRG